MRSDHLKRHIGRHNDIISMTDEEVREELHIRHTTHTLRNDRQQKIEEIAEQEGIPLIHCRDVIAEPVAVYSVDEEEEDMLRDNQHYLEKIERGEGIANIINKGTIREGSLSRERKEALYLYRKEEQLRDLSQAELRPWQQQLLEITKVSSEREVIWVIGKNGNEGKSWFQDYLESCLGFNRVMRLDLRIKHKDICNILKKRPLTSIDIFLFNDGRSIPPDENTYYRILENIKDGYATSSKYDNDVIKFKRPNTVIVFSNTIPDWSKLSDDRWKSFRIENNQLIIHGDNDNI